MKRLWSISRLTVIPLSKNTTAVYEAAISSKGGSRSRGGSLFYELRQISNFSHPCIRGEQMLPCQRHSVALTICELGNGALYAPFPDRARALPRETVPNGVRREGCKGRRCTDATTPPSCLRQSTVSAAQGRRRLGRGFCPQWQKPQFAVRARHTVACA